MGQGITTWSYFAVHRPTIYRAGDAPFVLRRQARGVDLKRWQRQRVEVGEIGRRHGWEDGVRARRPVREGLRQRGERLLRAW